MKVLLIQPPIRDFYDTEIRLQPLGLCMLKAVVRRFLPHTEVLVADYHQGFGRRTLPYPPQLSYLHEYYPYPDASPFCTFHNYYHFGLPFEEIGNSAARERPDLVGISSLFSPYYREALSCAREIRKRLNVPIIMGGSHVSASPLSVLRDPCVDFVIRGEGERPFVEFLKVLESGGRFEKVPNLGFKRDGETVLNAMEENYAFEDLPVADFSDLPRNRYLYRKRPLCFVTTSRGCPHRCAFCSVHVTFGEGFRRRSPENVVSEIKQRHSEGYRIFDFEDDNLSFHEADFKRLLRLLIAEFPQEDAHFMAMNGISYHSLDEEMLGLMKKAGFTSLNISLVSAEEAVLCKVGRPHRVEKYLEVVDQAHRLGFEIVSYQILGLPYEALDDMVKTMVLMARLPVLIGASIFYLTPGSPMAADFPPWGEMDSLKSRSTAMALETDRFSRDDLYTLFIMARIINFLKGLRIEKKTMTIQEAMDGAAALGKRVATGAELLTRLFTEKRLYAETRQGLKPLSRFEADLFLRVWNDLSYVRTRQGGIIDVGPLTASGLP